MVIDWLRPLLEVDTSLQPEEFIKCVFSYFENVYRVSKNYYGTPVYFQIRGRLTYLNSGFRHFVTHKSDYFTRDASIDIQRSLRVHWIEDVLKNHFDPVILAFEKNINNENRIHLIIPEKRFMVVLAFNEVKRLYYIRTTFYIDNDHKLNGYLRDYRKYKEYKLKKEDPHLPVSNES